MQVTDEKGELKTITLPVANLMPLTNKDEFFRAALGRGESEADKKAREIKEGKWPHPDMIQATHVDNLLYGPQIEFKVIDPNAKKEHYDSGNNNNGKKHQQDDNNSNPNDTKGKGDEREVEEAMGDEEAADHPTEKSYQQLEYQREHEAAECGCTIEE